MIYIQELNTGEIITVSKFCFTNIYGGTGLSEWSHNERWTEPVQVKIIKRWDDEETGERGWATPYNPTPEFLEYLKRNAKEGKYNNELEFIEKKGSGYILYVSEFDIKK